MSKLLVLLVLPVALGAVKSPSKGNVFCKKLPQQKLEDTLGAAYNEQLMSIEEPGNEIDFKQGLRKTLVTPEPPFYVDEDYVQVHDAPAWTVKSHVGLFSLQVNNRSSRIRRATKHKCQGKVDFEDLGFDYFPRFLLKVTCAPVSCGCGKCGPRTLRVKLLKRLRGRCVEPPEGATVGDAGLPQELVENWVWEERAVVFCCDCLN